MHRPSARASRSARSSASSHGRAGPSKQTVRCTRELTGLSTLRESPRHPFVSPADVDRSAAKLITLCEDDRHYLYRLRALGHIRPAITAEDANMIACSVVGARLDYANAVLYGVSKKNISRLQRIQNALARCVVDSKLHLNSNASLQHLHWLPVDYRIKFKIAKFAFLASTSATSSYLNSLVARYSPSR